MTALWIRPGRFPVSVESHLTPARRHWHGARRANSAAIMAKCGSLPRDVVQPLSQAAKSTWTSFRDQGQTSVLAAPVALIPGLVDTHPNSLGAWAQSDRGVQKHRQNQSNDQCVDGHSVSPLLPPLPVARQLLKLSIVPLCANRRFAVRKISGGFPLKVAGKVDCGRLAGHKLAIGYQELGTNN